MPPPAGVAVRGPADPVVAPAGDEPALVVVSMGGEPAFVVAPPGGTLGYGVLMQQPLESAPGPLWGAWSNVMGEYNDFSLLLSIEKLFGLKPLGYAGAKGLLAFDSSVFNAFR